MDQHYYSRSKNCNTNYTLQSSKHYRNCLINKKKEDQLNKKSIKTQKTDGGKIINKINDFYGSISKYSNNQNQSNYTADISTEQHTCICNDINEQVQNPNFYQSKNEFSIPNQGNTNSNYQQNFSWDEEMDMQQKIKLNEPKFQINIQNKQTNIQNHIGEVEKEDLEQIKNKLHKKNYYFFEIKNNILNGIYIYPDGEVKKCVIYVQKNNNNPVQSISDIPNYSSHFLQKFQYKENISIDNIQSSIFISDTLKQNEIETYQSVFYFLREQEDFKYFEINKIQKKMMGTVTQKKLLKEVCTTKQIDDLVEKKWINLSTKVLIKTLENENPFNILVEIYAFQQDEDEENTKQIYQILLKNIMKNQENLNQNEDIIEIQNQKNESQVISKKIFDNNINIEVERLNQSDREKFYLVQSQLASRQFHIKKIIESKQNYIFCGGIFSEYPEKLLIFKIFLQCENTYQDLIETFNKFYNKEENRKQLQKQQKDFVAKQESIEISSCYQVDRKNRKSLIKNQSLMKLFPDQKEKSKVSTLQYETPHKCDVKTLTQNDTLSKLTFTFLQKTEVTEIEYRKIRKLLKGEGFFIQKYFKIGGEASIYSGFEIVQYNNIEEIVVRIIKPTKEQSFTKEEIINKIKQEHTILNQITDRTLNSISAYRCQLFEEECIGVFIFKKYKQTLSDEIKMLKKNNLNYTKLQIGKMLVDLFNGLIELILNNIVHQDIKLSNILLSSRNKYKYSDYGCSGKLNEQGKAKVNGFSLYFCSPEQQAKEEITHKSDIYSLGKTLLVVLDFYINQKKLLKNQKNFIRKDDKPKFVECLKQLVQENMVQKDEKKREDLLVIIQKFISILIQYNQTYSLKYFISVVKFQEEFYLNTDYYFNPFYYEALNTYRKSALCILLFQKCLSLKDPQVSYNQQDDQDILFYMQDIGNNYSVLKQPEKALLFYHEYLYLKKRKDDKYKELYRGTNINSTSQDCLFLGNCQYKLNNYDLALYYYNQSFKKQRNEKSDDIIFIERRLLYKILKCCFKLKQYNSDLSYFENKDTIYEQKCEYSYFAIQFLLGQFYLKVNKIDKAVKSFSSFLEEDFSKINTCFYYDCNFLHAGTPSYTMKKLLKKVQEIKRLLLTIDQVEKIEQFEKVEQVLIQLCQKPHYKSFFKM